MVTQETKSRGRFAVEFEIANNQDVNLALGGHLDPAKVRRKTIK